MCSGATQRNKAPCWVHSARVNGRPGRLPLPSRRGGQGGRAEERRGRERRGDERSGGERRGYADGGGGREGGSFVIACALLHCVISSSIQLSEICFSFLLFRILRRSQFDASFVSHWYTSVASLRCQKQSLLVQLECRCESSWRRLAGHHFECRVSRNNER